VADLAQEHCPGLRRDPRQIARVAEKLDGDFTRTQDDIERQKGRIALSMLRRAMAENCALFRDAYGPNGAIMPGLLTTAP